MCRYVWLPLWVLPSNTEETLEGYGRERSGEEGHDDSGAEQAPADVVVRWHDLWRLSDFDRVPHHRGEWGRVLHM